MSLWCIWRVLFFVAWFITLLYSVSSWTGCVWIGAHSLTSPPSWSRGLSSWSSLTIGYCTCGCWAAPLSILGITFEFVLLTWGGLEIVLCYCLKALLMTGFEGSGTGTARSCSATSSSSSLIFSSLFFYTVNLSPPSFCDLISSSSMFLLAAAAVSNCDSFTGCCAYEKTPLRGPEDSILALLKTEALSSAFGCMRSY